MSGRAAECFDHEDYGCARLKIQAVLGKQPDCAEALWIYSFLIERDGHKDEANAMRTRALAINPDLAHFWEKRGRAIESRLSTQEFAHFEVSFDGAEDRDKAWQVLGHLDDAYNEMGSLYGDFPTKKIAVVVFTTPEFMDAWRSPFVGGFFDQRDGKVRVRMDDVPGGDDAYRLIARHEFAHAFMNQYSPLKDLPLWFVEGTAQFYAYFNPTDSFWKDKRLDDIREETKGYPWMNFQAIQEAISRKQTTVGAVYLAYLESEALILHIAQDHGDSWIPGVMNHLRAGLSFDQAFVAVIGITPAQAMEQLQSDWE